MMLEVLSIAPVLMVLSIYVWSGLFFKTRNFHLVAQEVRSVGLPFPVLCVGLAVLLEVGGSVVLLMPSANVPALLRLGVIGGFMLYTLMAALLFHPFWRFSGPEAVHQKANFLKNVGLMGAFMLLAARASG
jgi:putative oxidoreductase